MELVQDLFLTASFALILSFLVAKLVAMAVVGREPEAEFREGVDSDGGVVMEEVSFEERRLKVVEDFQGQRRVEFVGEVKEVDQFEGEPVHRVEQIEEALQHHRECRGLTGGEELVAVGLPKSSDGEEKVSAEKASDFDRQNTQNRGAEEIGAESAASDVVTAQSEEVKAVAFDEANEVELKASDFDRGLGHDAQRISEDRGIKEIGAESAANEVFGAQSEAARVVNCNEPKGKTRVGNEVKSDNYSDEDDWEGIEKSELDDECAGTVKFETK